MSVSEMQWMIIAGVSCKMKMVELELDGQKDGLGDGSRISG